jgi:penicillin-binding protein 1A
MPDDQPRPESSRRAAPGGGKAPPLTVIDGDGARGRGNGVGTLDDGPAGGNGRRGGRRRGPRLNKLRLALILGGLAILALISTVFGMLMAVAQDLPSLETTNEFRASRNSFLLDSTGKKDKLGHRIAVLTGNENRILIGSRDISPSVKHAVVAIEDQRFYRHKGLDYQGIARALGQDLLRRKAAQGGSTITQQFVKNALLAQTNRSIFQKLKEAALAYQLERKWSKDKILTQYLNTVYFGEGAYGIESAARVYFGWDHPGCEPRCAAQLDPAESAMLAGLIASPTAYSPVQNPAAAIERRNLVLERMKEQRFIFDRDYDVFSKRALPPVNKIRPPHKISEAPYFSSWVEQQLVDRYGTGATFGGGLKITTTLDLDYQRAAEQAIARISGLGPSAALVALDNKTGGVRAMVGGADFEHSPFNLATQGHRQPGSAFKPFTLIAALEKGISPGRTFASAPKTLHGPRGNFKVENYEDRYSGSASLATATTVSDNSVYAEVGYQLVGTKAIARTAERMGIRTAVSRNPAMILGGLRVGVTPLELTDAYLTLAHAGSRVSGSLAAYEGGPVAYTRVDGAGINDKNEVKTKRVIPEGVARQATQILQTVVSSGTGKNAAIGGFAAGKTGTTENYQDAWFVGFNETMTVAVWVGYPKGGRAMESEYHGEPVAGGTYPAELWRDFMLRVKAIREARAQQRSPESVTGPTGPAPVAPAPSTETGPQQTEPTKPKRKRRDERSPKPPDATPAPEPTEPPDTNPQPTPGEPPPTSPAPPSGGAGAGGAGDEAQQ